MTAKIGHEVMQTLLVNIVSARHELIVLLLGMVTVIQRYPRQLRAGFEAIGFGQLQVVAIVFAGALGCLDGVIQRVLL